MGSQGVPVEMFWRCMKSFPSSLSLNVLGASSRSMECCSSAGFVEKLCKNCYYNHEPWKPLLNILATKENCMQSNPNPNDPNYMPPLQENPQGVPPYQPGQPVYQKQPGVP